ncbi:MAG: metallophosphoesterase family protein [Gemmataceae bacterium]
MRHLAIGDVHGWLSVLVTLVEFVGVREDDVVVTLGDYIDRGPDSYGVIEWLLGYQQRGNLVPLLGNHEAMMLDARHDRWAFNDWQDSGGKQTLQSYSPLGDAGKLTDVPDEHWDFLENTCRRYYETDTHIFVHANLYPDLPMDEQSELILLWEYFEDPAPHYTGKTMVCGHTRQLSGQPKNVGHAVCIDTNVNRSGWLTCLDVNSGMYWQANKNGETRANWLDEAHFDDC